MKCKDVVSRPAALSCGVLALMLMAGIQAPARAATPIDGSWYVTADGGMAVASFLQNGEFMLVTHRADGSDPNGIEWGTFDWQPQKGGTQVFPTVDTNGDSGLSSGGGFSPAKLEGGQLWIQDHDGFGNWTALSRVPQGAGTLLGTWYWLPESGSAPSTFTFFADGTYLMAEVSSLNMAPESGYEYGRYSWNAATGDLLITEIIADANGDLGGSSHVNQPGYFTSRIGADGVMTFAEAGNDAAHFARVLASPVPEPATWALWLSAAGLLGCLRHRSKAGA